MPSTQVDVIDGVSTSTAVKAPVRSVITTNVGLSGLAAVTTIDGSLTPADGDRWLCVGQTAGAENLIYISRSGAWEIAPDSDGARDLRDGTMVKTQGEVLYSITTADPIVPGTTSLTWQRLNSTPFNEQTGTTYTLTAADNDKIVRLTNGSAITLTLPQTSTTTIGIPFLCGILQGGAGQVTVVKEGSDTIESSGSLVKLYGQHSFATIAKRTAGSPNNWVLFGDIAA